MSITGIETLTGFVTHLGQYQPLFRVLADFRFVYISGTRTHFEKVTALFNSAIKIPLESDFDRDLIRYFRARSIWNSSEVKTMPRGNGFHALRHANATLMNSFGASQKLRQQRLGHADGSPVTDTIYTHVISEDGKRIAAQLGKAVGGVLDRSWTLKENGSGVESPKPLYLN